MGANSAIEWTTHTFNPWHGCVKVSPGCEHCYAETLSRRFGHDVWGPAKTTPRRGMSVAYWKEPHRWEAAAAKAGQRARVFCASMADVFENHPMVWEWRQDLFGVIEETQHLDWLLLTKRPENMRAMLPADWLRRPRANVWLGTSVEDQRRADERIPHLLRVPAAVRFLSCEPLLGPIDLSPWVICPTCHGEGTVFQTRRIGRASFVGNHVPCSTCHGEVWRRDLAWVIVGGESGPRHRPLDLGWARRLREDCQNAGIAFFFKQVGGPTPKAGGRLLDGREWNEVPV